MQASPCCTSSSRPPLSTQIQTFPSSSGRAELDTRFSRTGWSKSRRAAFRRRAVERDIDWEPELRRAPAAAPPKSNTTRPPLQPPPPPPPPPPSASNGIPEGPFKSRRDIALTMIGGSAALWLYNNKINQPVEFVERPDVPFNLVGYTDVGADDFVYFRTPGGNWVAQAVDEQGRVYFIDQLGDLYYDSGNPEIGMYVMDTEGNLFNFYQDTDKQRKITPVGNVADLKRFKINEIAGVKLDRDVGVVAFQDGREIPLPPGLTSPPGELVEGVQLPPENPFSKLFGGSADSRAFGLDRYEVDLQDPDSFEKQLYDQTLLDDPDLPGFQAPLPEDFDLEKLADEVEREAAQGKGKAGRR